MTAIVGIYCRDGVVIGCDSSATFSHGQFRTIEQPTEKLNVIGNQIIVAGTGSVGLGQRFCSILRSAHDEKVLNADALHVVKQLSRATIEDFGQTYLKPGQYGALVAFPTGQRHQLCEFQLADFQPELKDDRIWYVSMGSSQPITDPFLGLMREVFWRDGLPKVQDAVFAVTWTLDHAIATNPGGVNGPARVAVLERGRKDRLMARILSDEELDEHRQYIEEAKARLRSIREDGTQRAPGKTPRVPEP